MNVIIVPVLMEQLWQKGLFIWPNFLVVRHNPPASIRFLSKRAHLERLLLPHVATRGPQLSWFNFKRSSSLIYSNNFPECRQDGLIFTEETFLRSSVIQKGTRIRNGAPFKKGNFNAQKAFTCLTLVLATKGSLPYSRFLGLFLFLFLLALKHYFII